MTLRSQRDDLMRLQLQKERLTAFVVHDLKNPVNAMDLHAQLFFATAPSPTTPCHRPADPHRRAAAHTHDPEPARSQQGRRGAPGPPARRRRRQKLVQSVIAELEVTAQARQVSLALDVTVARIRVDEDLVRRLTINLVENAVRHAPSQSTVVVTVAEDRTAVDLRVVDAGTGVSPDMRETIFEPFVQVEGGDRVVARAGGSRPHVLQNGRRGPRRSNLG